MPKSDLYNRPQVYTLIALVAIVWGTVFFRVFKSWGDDGYPAFEPDISAKAEFENYSITDTVTLNLNHGDPFRLSNARTAVEKVAESSPRRYAAAPAERKRPAPILITYSGYIQIPGSRKVLSMLNLKGKDLLIAEGEVAEDVKLLKNLKDSIKVAYKGNISYIALSARE